MSNPYDPNRPEQPGISGGQYPPQQPYPQQPYPQQPSYPAQPTYPGAQPYYPQPGPYSTPMMPPPMPPKKSNKTLWIVLGTIGGVLVLLCVGCGLLVSLGGGALLQQASNNPVFGSALVIGEFCGYEQQQDYPHAYQLFSPTLQGQMTQDQFTQASQAHDTADGTVSTCQTIQGGNSSVTDTSASFEITVTRSGGTNTTGTVTLMKTDGTWKIDSIDSSLSLD